MYAFASASLEDLRHGFSKAIARSRPPVHTHACGSQYIARTCHKFHSSEADPRTSAVHRTRGTTHKNAEPSKLRTPNPTHLGRRMCMGASGHQRCARLSHQRVQAAMRSRHCATRPLAGPRSGGLPPTSRACATTPASPSRIAKWPSSLAGPRAAGSRHSRSLHWRTPRLDSFTP